MQKFSIITTAYRHEKFIAQTIESILDQSFTDWELLIWDDSSNNDTWNIIQEYTDKYPDKIRAWHHIPNKGIVENMNFLISQTSPDAQYISFLEGDDMYTSDCLDQKLNIFQQYPEVWLVYSDMDFMNANGEITLKGLLRSQWQKFYQRENIPPNEYILVKNSLIVSYSSVAIRKEILDQFSPIRNLTGSKTYAVSDYDLFFRISSRFPVYGIKESLTQYRRHETNLSASYGWLFDDLSLLIGSYHHDQLIPEVVYRKKISWVYLLQSISSLFAGNSTDAWDMLKKSSKKSFFSYILYKIAIFWLLLMPTFLTQKILKKIMRRWV